MRTIVASLLALLFLFGTSAGALAVQDDSTPEEDEDQDSGEFTGNPVSPAVGDTITYLDEEGDAIATITVTDIETNWEGYSEYSAPERGTSYVRFSVEVENLTERSTVEIREYGFGLQDAYGYFWGTAFVSVDEDPEPALIESTLELEGEDSAEFSLVFQVYDDVPMTALYYSDSGVLLTLVNLTDIEE